MRRSRLIYNYVDYFNYIFYYNNDYKGGKCHDD